MAAKRFGLALIFTGHMVDLPGRKVPRLPQAVTAEADRRIIAAVEQAKVGVKGPLIGIASGARGGDIMFHEACRLHGIETHIILPFPAEIFVGTSVDGVPETDWTDRFWTLWNATPPDRREVLLDRESQPGYALCNQRILQLARELGRRIAMITLWNGDAGDGPGGTGEFTYEVGQAGGTVAIIDTRALLSDHAGRTPR